MTEINVKDPDFYVLQLLIPCKIISHTKKLIGNKLIASYTVHIMICNSHDGEFIIYSDDPRYKLIEDYMGDKNIFKVLE
jgi:hypothetical protein